MFAGLTTITSKNIRRIRLYNILFSPQVENLKDVDLTDILNKEQNKTPFT